MGRTPRRSGTQTGGVGGGSRRFLFDENVTSIGRALAHVYEQVVVLEDTDGLGRGADDDKHIIPWCVEHQAVWVTKDWRRRRNPEQASSCTSLACPPLGSVRAETMSSPSSCSWQQQPGRCLNWCGCTRAPVRVTRSLTIAAALGSTLCTCSCQGRCKARISQFYGSSVCTDCL
jgi:hypothetical protein